MKKVNYLFSVLLALAVLICGAATVSAATILRLTDTNQATVKLTFSGTTAYCDATVTGASGTTSITNGHLVLKDSDNNVVAEWTGLSSSSKKLTVSKSVSGLTKGEKYTLTFSATVKGSNGTETISKSATKTCS